MKQGIKPKPFAHLGYTPLMIAAMHGNSTAIGLLYQQGANLTAVNTQDSSKTVLCYALEYNHPETAKKIITLLNIDINNPNQDQYWLPQQIIKFYANKNLDVFECLYHIGFDFLRFLKYLDDNYHFSALQKLISLGVPYDINPSTRLHSAIHTMSFREIPALLHMKADMRSRGPEGSFATGTVLHEVNYAHDRINKIKILAYDNYPLGQAAIYDFRFVAKLPKVHTLQPQTIYIYTNSKKELVYGLITPHKIVRNQLLDVPSANRQSEESKKAIHAKIIANGHISLVHNRYFNSPAATTLENKKTPFIDLKCRKNLLRDLFWDQAQEIQNDALYYLAHTLISQLKKYDFSSKKAKSIADEKNSDFACGLNILYNPILPVEIKSLIWDKARYQRPNTYTPAYTEKSDRQAKALANTMSINRFGIAVDENHNFLTQDFSNKKIKR